MVGVVDGGSGGGDGCCCCCCCCWGSDDVVALAGGAGCEDEGRKDIDSVPEKRTTDTARATGRTAVRGLG